MTDGRPSPFWRLLLRKSTLLWVVVIFGFQNCSGFDPFRTNDSSTESEMTSLSKPFVPSIAKTLSRQESLFAAQDLIGAENVPDSVLHLLPPDEKNAGFESAAYTTYDRRFVESRLAFADEIAERAMRSSKVLNCSTLAGEEVAWAGCIEQMVISFAQKAFRRPPTAQEKETWRNLYVKTAQSAVQLIPSVPTGHLDVADASLRVAGWSLDPDWSDRPVQIHFYVDGPAGSGTFAGHTFTRLPRPDVINYFRTEGFEYSGYHGFSFNLPARWADGASHTVYAYAIGMTSSTSGGSNPLIGSKSFRANSAGTNSDFPPPMGVSTRDGIKTVLSAILMSPSFMLREAPVKGDDDLELIRARRLAERLSLFLSASVPDETLSGLAENRRILDRYFLRQEAKRLLDQRTDRFVANSFGQWFGFRDFGQRTNLSDLERSMVAESHLVFAEILRERLPAEAILMPGFTFVDRRLAEHYGVSGAPASGFARIPQSDRGGVLTQGALLRLTSPTPETKVIQRGKWVLGALLCRTIPSPDAALFEEIAKKQKDADPTWSVSQRLAVHRESPTCFACHKHMDPLGLGLEMFDSFGRVRSHYPDGKIVEADGDLDGVTFEGARQLAPLLLRDQVFRECVTQKLMTQALGRPLEITDLALVADLSKKGLSVRDLIVEIVVSNQFISETRGEP